MLRATIGTWLNYATTLGFQVLFVARFGTTDAASAYVLAFTLVMSVAGILVSTAQTVVSGRLLANGDQVRMGSIKLLASIVAAALILSCGLVVFAPELGQALSTATNYPPGSCEELFRDAGALCFLQVLAGATAVVALVRGSRVWPAVAPAMPTLVAAGGLAMWATVTPSQVLQLFVVGSVLQLALVTVPAVSGIKLMRSTVPRATSTTLLMVASLSLVSLIAPVERLLAGIHTVQDIAAYDYGLRSLRAVQQLIVGGAILATLGDWSVWSSGGNRRELSKGLLSSVSFVAIMLALAASIAAVAGRGIVVLAYQHGSFNAADTTAVVGVVIFGLPGFCAEGIGLLLTYALAGARYNMILALLGVGNFTGRVLLALALGPLYGAVGVAVGYSVAGVAILLPTMYLVATRLIDPALDIRRFGRVAIVAGGTIASALVLATLASHWPALVNGLIVTGICGLLMFRFRPVSSVQQGIA